MISQILNITKDENYSKNLKNKTVVEELGKEIDNLVFELYEIDPEDIKIIENKIK